jgi:hypothetical protein
LDVFDGVKRFDTEVPSSSTYLLFFVTSLRALATFTLGRSHRCREVDHDLADE